MRGGVSPISLQRRQQKRALTEQAKQEKSRQRQQEFQPAVKKQKKEKEDKQKTDQNAIEQLKKKFQANAQKKETKGNDDATSYVVAPQKNKKHKQ